MSHQLEEIIGYHFHNPLLRHQGSKGEKFTADIVGEKAGESGRTVHRYIRLTELIPGMLEMVDNNMINVGIGERLSYLKKTEQEYLLKLFVERNIRIKKEQITAVVFELLAEWEENKVGEE